MQAAIQTLVDHVDHGAKPSARAAATQSGLDRRQSKKLAYATQIKRETVRAAVDLRLDSPFIQALLEEQGWHEVVVAGHVSLSKLASTLLGASKSLAERVARLEAVNILILAEQQAQRDKLIAAGIGGNSAGEWHPQALAMLSQGMKLAQVARKLGKSPEAVRKLRDRKALALILAA
jgi:hypothetical protein